MRLWITGGVLVIGGIIGLILSLTTPKVVVTYDDFVQSSGDVNHFAESVYALGDIYGSEEEGYIEPSPEEAMALQADINEYLQHYKTPESAIEYFFSTALAGHPDLFIESMSTDVFVDALAYDRNPDKFAVTEDIIQRIARNGTLTSVHVERARQVFSRDQLRLVTELTYEGAEPFRLGILVEKHEDQGENHGHGESDFYVVATSPWDIISLIERKTN